MASCTARAPRVRHPGQVGESNARKRTLSARALKACLNRSSDGTRGISSDMAEDSQLHTQISYPAPADGGPKGAAGSQWGPAASSAAPNNNYTLAASIA